MKDDEQNNSFVQTQQVEDLIGELTPIKETLFYGRRKSDDPWCRGGKYWTEGFQPFFFDLTNHPERAKDLAVAKGVTRHEKHKLHYK
jgi:hypothetical protein